MSNSLVMIFCSLAMLSPHMPRVQALVIGLVFAIEAVIFSIMGV